MYDAHEKLILTIMIIIKKESLQITQGERKWLKGFSNQTDKKEIIDEIFPT
jgi:hypothetical protein